MRTLTQTGLAALALMMCLTATAQDAAYPEPQRHNYVIENFEFESGDVLPEMNVSYLTIGDPANPPVLITHGTTGQATSMLCDKFGQSIRPRPAAGCREILFDTCRCNRRWTKLQTFGRVACEIS